MGMPGTIAVGVLVVLLMGLGLHRWRPARPSARVVAAAAGEDVTEARLQQAVGARPNDAAAHRQLGQYEEGQARPFEALWEYAEARRLSPADRKLPLRLAAALRAGEAPEMAMPLLTGALRARPDDLEARRQIVDLSLSTAEPLRACSVLAQKQEAVWKDAETAITLGRARQASGDDAGARAAFRRALALDNKKDEALYRLGQLSLREGRIDEARDAFFHAMFYRQNRPEYPFSAGMTYLRQPGPNSLDRALRFFRNTLALRSNDAPAQYESGVALERMGRQSPALTHYSLATVADPTYPDPLPALSRGLLAVGRTPDAHRFLGRYADLKDRPADAIREYQRMQAADPDSVEPALLIGQVYIRTLQSEKAIAVTEAALKRHPRDSELIERLSVLNINRGDWPSARRLLLQWLAADPKAARPCWLLGRCALGELKYAEAVDWLEKAIALEPHNPHYLGFLGAALLKLGTVANKERAAVVLAQAVDLAPDEAEYHDLYGQALEPARRQFLRALDADPLRIAAYLAVSQLAGRLNHPGPAALFPPMVRSVQQRLSEESLLQRHVWQHPEDAAGRLKLARFFCRIGKPARARDEMEAALARQPAFPEAQALMVTVQRSLEAL